MLDYRSLISPGLEFFDSQNSPINQIDVERVEVVLGRRLGELLLQDYFSTSRQLK